LKYTFSLKMIALFQRICYLQRMLKVSNSVKIELDAATALRSLLAGVPPLGIRRMEHGGDAHGGYKPDITVHIDVGGSPRLVMCEVKAVAQPRHVTTAILQLQKYIGQAGPSNATPMLIAPYLSPQARAQCVEASVAYLDFTGNARLAFDGIYIDRQVSDKPASERRELKSLFKPKSAQVLRIMLLDPARAWKVIDLSKATGVSLGHVSNVRNALLDREWAEESTAGVHLSSPDVLLDEWRAAYEPLSGQMRRFYTSLHGAALEAATRKILEAAANAAILASFSAAQWLAPFVRSPTLNIYAEEGASEKITEVLGLRPVDRGENVVVTIPDDDGVFSVAQSPAAGIVCTSDVQTYLDLTQAGERGVEAAEHLRRERLTWNV
jgi:hypothetical protein